LPARTSCSDEGWCRELASPDRPDVASPPPSPFIDNLRAAYNLGQNEGDELDLQEPPNASDRSRSSSPAALQPTQPERHFPHYAPSPSPALPPPSCLRLLPPRTTEQAAQLKRSAASDIHPDALKAKRLKLSLEPCEREDMLPRHAAAVHSSMPNFASTDYWRLWPLVAATQDDWNDLLQGFVRLGPTIGSLASIITWSKTPRFPIDDPRRALDTAADPSDRLDNPLVYFLMAIAVRDVPVDRQQGVCHGQMEAHSQRRSRPGGRRSAVGLRARLAD
jgi:hypothetical protein